MKKLMFLGLLCITSIGAAPSPKIKALMRRFEQDVSSVEQDVENVFRSKKVKSPKTKPPVPRKPAHLRVKPPLPHKPVGLYERVKAKLRGNEYSVNDYIKEYGMPTIEYGTLDLSRSNSGLFTDKTRKLVERRALKSLSGLEKIPGIQNVKVLILGLNEFIQLSSSDFAPVPNLEMLLLNGSKIGVIKSDAFSSLKHLNYLDLEEAVVDHIEADALTNVAPQCEVQF